MKDDSFSQPSRRRVLQAAAAFGTLGFPAVLRFARAQSRRIVVRDDGGIYTKAYGECFYKPFTQKTGIEVIGVQANAEPVAQIKSMVDTKNYTWDMGKISQPAILLLTEGGKVYLEKHGLENDPNVRTIPKQFMSPYGVGTNVYSTVLAYRTDAFKNRKAPSSWADLWDPKAVPGRRSLRKHPFDTMEESLMASGVPTSQLYPLNIDRALQNLDKVKPNVDVWWNSGAQATQLLTSGEVDMIAVWASRPQQAMSEGAPVAISWNQNLWGVDNWSILAGTPNADACREFIKFASDVHRMAQQCDYYPAGVTQPEAFKYIKPEVAKNSPTHPDNIKNGVQINAKYWLDNQAAVTEKFNAWVLK